jgi:amino acid adenylation domain-containing protein
LTVPLVHELLSASAERYPEHPAVVDRERSLTYAALEQRANQLARLLVERGVAPGDRVGIYLDKSLEAIVGVYGVMKAGGVYVPFDPQAPPARLAYIAANADISHLVTGTEKARIWTALKEHGAPVRTLIVPNLADPAEAAPSTPGGVEVLAAMAIDAQDGGPLGIRRDLGDLAYILYTSGSTGDPKGVMLSHLNAMAFIEWSSVEFGVGPDDRLSSHAPLHFDLSVFDLYAAAHSGAAVALVPSGISAFPIEVARFMQDARITVWYSVPSILSMLVLRGNLPAMDLSDLRTVLFAGEVFPTKYLVRLMALIPHARFANLFGPTETNVCTWYEVPRTPLDESRTIPIGKPIHGVQALVTDEDGREVPEGEAGELLIKGPTVMEGYWADTERSKRVLENVASPTERVYRTGDLARYGPAGDLIFLGRRDSQIKSRGYRIELGDIEAALNAYPAMVECAVVPVPDDVFTNKIAAYVVVRDGADAASLSRFCQERLPRYMVPDSFQLMDALPKSSTGKIDRRALSGSV